MLHCNDFVIQLGTDEYVAEYLMGFTFEGGTGNTLLTIHCVTSSFLTNQAVSWQRQDHAVGQV
jgi:hypothetical protein